jgi:CheY-like chemotaxis protein
VSKILIAEDYKPLVKLYATWLELDHEIIPAYTGQEAVDNYKEHKPDLVIMDIRMPDKTGDVAIDEIFEMEPEANIVAVTGYPYSEDDLGVEVVRKGFSRREFLEMVDRKLTAITAIA